MIATTAMPATLPRWFVFPDSAPWAPAPLGAATLARLRRSPTTARPRRPFSRGATTGGDARMEPELPIDPSDETEGLTLDQAWHRWGPPDLVREADEVGTKYVPLCFFPGPGRKGHLKNRQEELFWKKTQWFQDMHSAGYLRIEGVPWNGSSAWEAVPRHAARSIDYGYFTTSVALEGDVRQLNGPAWTGVRVWRVAEAIPVSGAGPLEKNGPRGYLRFDKPLARELVKEVDAGHYASDHAAAAANHGRAEGTATPSSKTKRIEKLMKELRRGAKG